MSRHDPTAVGVFETPPPILGGLGGEMKCPTCDQNTPDAWKPLWVMSDDGSRTHGLSRGMRHHVGVNLQWMMCANEECKELVIVVHQIDQTIPGQPHTLSWLACPRRSQRSVDSLVPEGFRRDYHEAAAILDDSPRMSAVLARKIVGDLLAQYANHTERRITQQIDGFNGNSSHPRRVRENLHHLREIADFGAHTQVNERAEIIEATREEAEWTLDVVDTLFDYFIVTPQRDADMRASFDEKIAQVPGRKPITPLPEDPPGEGS